MSVATGSRRWQAIARLMRLDRPIGTLLLLWPTLWALWIAGAGRPRQGVLIVFVLGVVVMRAAGCVINDYFDRQIDRQVRRTRERPLASGELSARTALVVFLILMAIALALVLSLSWPVIRMAVPGALLAATYPLFKRFTHWPQVYLGIAFGWGIPMAFVALQGGTPLVCWLLFAANVCWVVAYDTWYAMVDREDDIAAGVRSTALRFGRHDRLAIGLLHGSALLLLALAGLRAELGYWYLAGLAAALLSALWQQVLAAGRERERCLEAFLHNSWFGAAVFCGIALHYTFAS